MSAEAAVARNLAQPHTHVLKVPFLVVLTSDLHTHDPLSHVLVMIPLSYVPRRGCRASGVIMIFCPMSPAGVVERAESS